MHEDPDQRPDPDMLLDEIRKEAAQTGGRLFIFLGMCPGVGKTFAMLQAGRQRRAEGVDVLVGIAETHGRSETAALLEGLEVLPRKSIEHRGHLVDEFDLDGALRRRPVLVLVDELAHTNAPGSRHLKRYQDVLELLDAGIDVYSTVNVQHIDSQIDIVRQITGVSVQETVPDSLLDQAHEIQLIDLSVDKLLERLGEGKVYLGDRARTAAGNFFREGNLTALREMALRFTAERVDRDLEDIRRARRVGSPWKTNARLMVGVGASPYSESLIRWTRRAATRLGCPWLVVWVEGTRLPDAAGQERLARALSLARKLGAEVVSATGDDVADALLRVARDRNVSQIVVGKPSKSRLWKRNLADRLVHESEDIDVCLVRPTLTSGGGDRKADGLVAATKATPDEYGWALGATCLLGVTSWLLMPFTGYSFAAMVFLFGIVLAALRLGRGPVLVMAASSALAWDFFFIPPSFTFTIEKPEDMVMFGMFFVVALSMGHLTTRLRQRELAERRRQRQTAALLRVTQSAALSAEPEKGLVAALRVINELLDAETALVVRNSDHSLPTKAHKASTFTPDGKEWGVVAWSYDHRQTAGRFTGTLPQSTASWFPLQTSTSTMGVLGILLPGKDAMDFATQQTIEAFALQLALVLEKEHFIEAASRAEVLEQSEKLRQGLLDSVSHELKTPLAVIRASLEGMGETGDPYVAEIATATARLQRVVDGLLQMTRLESKALKPRADWCDIRDVIASARESGGGGLRSRPVEVRVDPEFPLVKLDHGLLSQALANLLHNADVYTPAGTAVEVTASMDGNGKLRIKVRDHGIGLPAGSEARVFEKFYRVPGSPAGGTGLGLAITRGFVQAQGGSITASNHPDGGAEFLIVLPVQIMSSISTQA
jgi:two-component system sensor histidine kinase KdpD